MIAPEMPPDSTSFHPLVIGSHILDDAPDAGWEALVAQLGDMLEMPLGFLAFAAHPFLRLTARRGLTETAWPLADTFCQTTLAQGAPLVVPDALASPYQDLGLVRGPYQVRSYAGVPILAPDGGAIGSLCVMDTQPRHLEAQTLTWMALLAQQVTRELLQRKACATAQAAQARYEDTLERVGVGIWEVPDFSQDARWHSPQVYRLLGYAPDEVELGAHALWERVHPDDRPKLQATLTAAPQRQDLMYTTLRLRTQSGDYRWFTSRGQTLWDAAHGRRKRVGILVDIHERIVGNLAFERFHEAQSVLQRLTFDTKSSETTYREAGLQALCHYLGLPNASLARVQGGVYEIVALVGPASANPQHQVTPGESFPMTHSLIGYLYNQEDVGTLENFQPVQPERYALIKRLAVETLIGAPVWVQGKPYGVVTCYGPDPRPAGFSELEQEFVRIFCRWLGFMKERYAYIEHLKRLNASKDRVLAVIAHDLRNPLAAIISARRVLARHLSESQGQAAQMLQVIEQACFHGSQLLDELLEAAELEELGSLPLEPLNLCAFVRHVFQEFEPRAATRQVTGQLALDTEHAIVPINPPKLQRVLENLLNNALKFTPAGGEIRLRVSTGEKQAWLWVEDTGIGIPQALQAVLFDKYSAARRQGLDGEKSNGLGMFIVKEIVELHGGHIAVESAEGQGTRFRIELPLVRAIPEA